MNPFIYNAPVRRNDFFNREETIQKAMNHLLGKAQGDVWLTGERQIGKTSLLQCLETSGTDYVADFIHYGTGRAMKPVFIYANVQGVAGADDFFGFLHYGLKSKFDMKARFGKNTYKNLIAGLIVAFNQGYYPVFLVDEFDSMLETLSLTNAADVTAFIKLLNATAETLKELPAKPKAFSCMYAANCSMNDLLGNLNLKEIVGSGLKFEAVELTWFSKEQVTGLVSQYLQNNALQLTSKEIELCHKYTQGYPYFTQKLLSIMYEQRPNFANEKEFENTIKAEFGREFEKTIKAWGAQKMPSRTVGKLKELAAKTGFE